MNILYLGFFDSQIWRAEYPMAQGLKEAGNNLYFINYSEKREILTDWLLLRDEIDLVFLQYGVGFHPKFLDLFVDIPLIFFASEAALEDSIHILTTARKPDLVLAHSMETYNFCIANNLDVIRVNNGFNEQFYYKIESDYLYDISFIGTISPRRTNFFEFLEKNGIKVFFSTNNNPKEINTIYNQSKIVIHCHSINKTYLPTRFFEVLPTQACLLIEEMGQDFDPKLGNNFFETFSGIEDVIGKINFLLNNEEYRKALSEKANQLAPLNTWKQRMREFNKILDDTLENYQETLKSKLNKKVLIGSPIKQRPDILKEFLISLSELELSNLNVDCFFIDDNHLDLSQELLQNFSLKGGQTQVIQENSQDEYRADDDTHYWNNNLIWKVAEYKNKIIDYAVENGYDYLFLVDSDLLLHPKTLTHLILADKDIIAEVFWTKWSEDMRELPQVWLCDSYYMLTPADLNLPPEKRSDQIDKFINMLKFPGIYRVGGLGACSLIKKEVMEKGVRFKLINNISFPGEDRHFCIRAEVMGFKLFSDTHYNALHIYRNSDFDKISSFKQWNTKGFKYYIYRGDNFLITGENEQAFAEYKIAYEKYNKEFNPKLSTDFGNLLTKIIRNCIFNQKDFTRVFPYLQELLNLFPCFPDAYYYMGYCLQQNLDYQGAIDIYTQGLKTLSTIPSEINKYRLVFIPDLIPLLQIELSRCLMVTGNERPGLYYLETAYKRLPGANIILLNLFKYYLLKNDLEKAIQYYIKNNPSLSDSEKEELIFMGNLPNDSYQYNLAFYEILKSLRDNEGWNNEELKAINAKIYEIETKLATY